MRTQEEIVEHIKERASSISSIFPFELNDLTEFLDFEHAKPYLKEGVTSEDWKQEARSPREIMIDYMPFAWEKANDCRWLSAMCSIMHYQAWLWLDGDEILWQSIEDYQFYGKPQLTEICKYLGLDASQWDDGIRRNAE